jgi:uncharacterized membrane protein YtjA (UPF0391 family)
MLQYALAFAVLAVICGILGFGVLGGTLAWIAKVCLLVFVVMLVVSLVQGGRQNRVV